MTTFLELQDETLDLAGLSSLEERARVKRFLNEEYLRLAAKVGSAIKSTPSVALVQGQGDYDLTAPPFSLTDFVRMQIPVYSWGNTSPFQTMPLTLVSPQKIFELRRNLVTGITKAFAINGLSTLMLYPLPMSGDSIVLSYEYRPSPMASDSDTPALIGYEDQSAVVYAAAYRAALLAKSPIAAGLKVELQERRDDAMASQNRLGGNAKSIRRVGRGFVPHDNSSDYRGFNGY